MVQSRRWISATEAAITFQAACGPKRSRSPPSCSFRSASAGQSCRLHSLAAGFLREKQLCRSSTRPLLGLVACSVGSFQTLFGPKRSSSPPWCNFRSVRHSNLPHDLAAGFLRGKRLFTFSRTPLLGLVAFSGGSFRKVQSRCIVISAQEEKESKLDFFSTRTSTFYCGEEEEEEESSGGEGDEDATGLSGEDRVEGETVVVEEEDVSYRDIKITAKGDLKPGLYLVGTPIGNLEDITLRALRVLKLATCILAEDTRHSAKLLRYYGIRTPTMSYHKFNQFARRGEIIQRLQQGDVLALISDAGMPGISDPGSDLVKACVEVNVQIFPVPGPSAALTALVASGLPTNEFSFVGFLSMQSSSRKQKLCAAAKESATQIFYVPPHKLCRVLNDLISAFGCSRRCAVAREMTKLHEEFWRGTLEEAKAEFEVRRPRGELTLIVQGLPSRVGEQLVTEDELKSRLQELMGAGKSPSEACKQVVKETATRRNVVYALALEIDQTRQPQ